MASPAGRRLDGGYVIRRAGSKQYPAFMITVPRDIADVVPDGARFDPVMTEDGILYRIMVAAAGTAELPSWASQKENTP